jgi:SAM-dependent methyltransferase
MLDIGCSSGFLLAQLRSSFPDAFVIGADVVRGPLLALAKTQPDVPLLHFDLTRCPLPGASVDVVFLLNVLEHIENDALAVQQLARILKPGGLAIVEVPAGPHLYDYYDMMLMHYRRYRQRDLRRLFQSSGFEIVRASHLGFFLYPPFALLKLLRRRKHAQVNDQEAQGLVQKDIAQTNGSALLGAVTRFELLLGDAIRFPFGIRCVLTARKPDAKR